MVNGMADGESRESGGEGICVCLKHFVPWVLTPVMEKFVVVFLIQEGRSINVAVSSVLTATE